MKAYCIVIKDNELSESAYSKLVESSEKVSNDFQIERFDAITPINVNKDMAINGVKWNYPWTGGGLDMASGLLKKAYPTKNPDSRIACAMSHYNLWKKCVEDDEPILILEHDAIFKKKINFNTTDIKYGIIGINNPIGNTRKAHLFDNKIQSKDNDFQPVPSIDSDNVPQGLAGNSAYIIKPSAAKHLIELVNQFGLWPNDAIMCKQLMPGELGVTKTYYTDTQKLKSTTTE